MWGSFVKIGASAFRLNSTQVLQRSLTNTQRLAQPIKNHQPNNMEKKFLVWTGKYKTVEEVPAHVSCDEMERCRNRVRIRMANIMIALTALGCCIMVYSGKQAAKRGDSLQKQNLDWHNKYNEEMAKKESRN